MRREFWRLAWRTLTCWRRATPDPPRPGNDGQWPDLPAIRNQHGRNPETQQDEDDRRWTP